MTTTEESQKPTIVSSNAIAYKDAYIVQENIIKHWDDFLAKDLSDKKTLNKVDNALIPYDDIITVSSNALNSTVFKNVFVEKFKSRNVYIVDTLQALNHEKEKLSAIEIFHIIYACCSPFLFTYVSKVEDIEDKKLIPFLARNMSKKDFFNFLKSGNGTNAYKVFNIEYRHEFLTELLSCAHLDTDLEVKLNLTSYDYRKILNNKPARMAEFISYIESLCAQGKFYASFN